MRDFGKVEVSIQFENSLIQPAEIKKSLRSQKKIRCVNYERKRIIIKIKHCVCSVKIEAALEFVFLLVK
jgi:hypothetical protein